MILASNKLRMRTIHDLLSSARVAATLDYISFGSKSAVEHRLHLAVKHQLKRGLRSSIHIIRIFVDKLLLV